MVFSMKNQKIPLCILFLVLFIIIVYHTIIIYLVLYIPESEYTCLWHSTLAFINWFILAIITPCIGCAQLHNVCVCIPLCHGAIVNVPIQNSKENTTEGVNNYKTSHRWQPSSISEALNFNHKYFVGPFLTNWC